MQPSANSLPKLAEGQAMELALATREPVAMVVERQGISRETVPTRIASHPLPDLVRLPRKESHARRQLMASPSRGVASVAVGRLESRSILRNSMFAENDLLPLEDQHLLPLQLLHLLQHPPLVDWQHQLLKNHPLSVDWRPTMAEVSRFKADSSWDSSCLTKRQKKKSLKSNLLMTPPYAPTIFSTLPEKNPKRENLSQLRAST
jgi:hypothetical protein